MADLLDPVNIGFMCLFCLLGILLPMPILRSYWNARYTLSLSACTIIVINALLCLQFFVNAIIWHNEDINNWWDGIGLCDIEAPLKYPLTLCLNLSLWRFMHSLATSLNGLRQSVLSAAEMRRHNLREALFCYLIPVLQIGLGYFFSAGRFTIVPVMGCAPLLDNSWLGALIMASPVPIAMILTVRSAIYVGYRMIKHRQATLVLLTSNGSRMRDRRFYRLVGLSFLVTTVYTGTQSYFFYKTISGTTLHYSLLDNYSSGWNLPGKTTLSEAGQGSQYIGWCSAAWNLAFFGFQGLERESRIETRKMAAALGLARIFPSLARPLPPRADRTWLQSNFLTSWLFDPETLRFDPCGSLFAWLATSPRPDKWVAGKVVKSFKLIERSMVSTSKWFRHSLQFNWSTRRPSTNSLATTAVGEDIELADKNISQITLDSIAVPAPAFASNNPYCFICQYPNATSSARYAGSLTGSPLRNEISREQIVEQPTTQPTVTASRRFGLTGLFSTFRTQVNLPTALFTRQQPTANVSDDLLPIPRVQSFPSLKGGTLSLLFPHPDLVETRMYTGNECEMVYGTSATSNSGAAFVDPLSSTHNVNTGNHFNFGFAYHDAELGIPSSSTGNPGYDFAFATRAASTLHSPNPDIELTDLAGWKGKGKETDD